VSKNKNKKPPPGTTDLVICSRVEDRPDPSQLYAGADAVQRVCADCGAVVWYSRSTSLRGTRAHLLCEPCSGAYGYSFARLPPGRG
jgi:hypothetical protein